MKSKPPTSFRLSDAARALLAQLAEREGMTLTAYLEHLIRMEAARSRKDTPMQFNPQTYKYEGEWNGQPVIVDSDAWAEAQDEAARQNFGIDYADLDDAQTAIIDREQENPFNWADTDDNEAK